MARPLRIELPGGLYHVTSRGDRQEPIYLGDADRAAWLALLGQVCERYNWLCHGYCQMTNHYHVVIETPDANLSTGMRQLNGVYTQDFNRRQAVGGHLFQGRFKAILVERDAYLLELSRYVVLNPVRAGMVRDAGGWPWSSYRAMVGQTPPPAWLETDWVLRQFGGARGPAREGFAAFVAEGIGLPAVWDGLRNQVFLGSEAFVDHMARRLEPSCPEPGNRLREVPRAQRRAATQTLGWYERQFSLRREAMARAFGTGVYSMQEIAQHFGVHYATVSRAVRWWESNPEQRSGVDVTDHDV